MTTFLFSATSAISQGWTLTLVSVSVVFSALLLLFLIYSLSGYVLSGRMARAITITRQRRRQRKETTVSVKTVDNSEIVAAIAVALQLFLDETVHDQESYVITIKRNSHERI